MAKYLFEKENKATGVLDSYLYECTIEKKAGTCSFKIKIVGAYYKGKPEPFVTVRRRKVRLITDEEIQKYSEKPREFETNLPYKD